MQRHGEGVEVEKKGLDELPSFSDQVEAGIEWKVVLFRL